MSELLVELSQKALSLSANEREQLAEDILMSLQDQVLPEVDAAWELEIRRRLQEVQSGAATLVPAEVVFAEARRLIAK